MTSQLDLVQLQKLCGSLLPDVGGGAVAWHVETALGQPGMLGLFAGNWLRDDVVDRAREWHGDMVGEPTGFRGSHAVRVEQGQVGILLATENAAHYPLLRPAFVLPLEWRRGGRSSVLLPAGMADFADGVLRDVRVTNLSLHLAARLEESGTDLSGLRFSYESAWAALAGGAIVVDQNGLTVPDVLVTAAWARTEGLPGWITGVGQVGEKLDEAAVHGASIVLLPQENAIEAGQWRERNPDSPLKIRHLSNVPNDPERVLAAVLQALEKEPKRTGNTLFTDRCSYYVRMAEEKLNEYYRDQLLQEIVEQLEPQIKAEPRLHNAERLVIIASKSWSLGFLLTALFDPEHVLILHDGRLGDVPRILTDKLETFARKKSPRRIATAAECRPGDAFDKDVADALTAFSSADGVGTVVDLTAGYREFHFAVLAALPANAQVMFVHAQQDPRYARIRPSTERVKVVSIAGR